MQADETCWFLAVDFDKSAWPYDVRAFVHTCRRLGLRPEMDKVYRARRSASLKTC
jgi:hypothetical protein